MEIQKANEAAAPPGGMNEFTSWAHGVSTDSSLYFLVAGWSLGGIENDEFDYLPGTCGEEEIKQKLAECIQSEKRARALLCQWASEGALGEAKARILARPSGISVWTVWVSTEGDFVENLGAAARRALGQADLRIECEGLNLAEAATEVFRHAAKARSRRDGASSQSLSARQNRERRGLPRGSLRARS